MNAPDCSIYLEVVTNNNSRSIAKLKCGHIFHLGEQSYAQYYEEEDETMLDVVGVASLVENMREGRLRWFWTREEERPIGAANGGPMHVEDEPNLELTLALRNGPPLSPSRNVPPLQQNEQAAVGTNLELSLAISNSTYGEQSSSSQIWLEDMTNMDDPNEEHDEETFRPNMIQSL
ncbi:hypothetical protein H5410_004583 [Solanum commersonii]|uniref:Uncharacterized protein n=1 Tax=Solanum commersonii TaxID=4109 RepID=A0A9J6B8E8_SOLCO|nr:hypothetical protein H5410_004583 [Solanum commersonii]